MGRDSTISAEQVNAIADSIKADGGKPTSRAIRERLGNTGSMGTINKLLQKWKSGHARQTSATLALPVPLQNSILDFMDQELAAARSALESELAEQQQEAADLASENERQAESLDALGDAMAALSADKATAEGKAAQLASDLLAAHGEATAERQAAEHARTELAKAQLRLEAMPRLVDDLDKARADLQEERLKRTEAERQAAVLAAQKDDLHARLAASDAEVQRVREAADVELARSRDEAAAELRRSREESGVRIEEARSDVARVLEQMRHTQQRLEALTGELSKAHAEAKSAAQEAAELRGRLAVAAGDATVPATAGAAPKATKKPTR